MTDNDLLVRLREALGHRLAGHAPRPAVLVATHALGWIARVLPRHHRVRAAVRGALGPITARAIRRIDGVFGLAPPDDERSPFVRAAHAWFGVESSAMVYDRTWRVVAAGPGAIIERVYARDDRGAVQAGCPWGMSSPDHGFACRTVMLGSRNVFAAIGSAEMRIDITIPEMLAAIELAERHVASTEDRDPDHVLAALESELRAIFERSQPEEPDFVIGGRLRPETVGVLREMIAALLANRRPAVFCQFRVVPQLVPADRLRRARSRP